MKHIFKASKNFYSLTECITENLALVSKSAIKKQMRLGEIKVNGFKTTSETDIAIGDEIKIFLPTAFDASAKPLDIVYQNDHIIAVNKPILCDVETHLTELVRQEFPCAEPMHRLDKNTTGLVLFAKTSEASAELLHLFKERKISKYYRVEVLGALKNKKMSVKVYLKKCADRSRVLVSSNSKLGYIEALLDYNVVKLASHTKGISVLDVKLVTGRTHQIRATMAHLGHPVIGDGKYGIDTINRNFNASYQRLIAYKIVFDFSANEVEAIKSLAGKTIELKSFKL